MTVWTRKGETSKLWSLIAGHIATVAPCGELWRANVFGPHGSSTLTADCPFALREWAERHWKRMVLHG